MKVRYLMAAAIAALSLGQPGSAQDTTENGKQVAPVDAPKQIAAKAEKQEKICKYQARTGTRFARKVCRTSEEWDAMAEAAKAGLNDMQRQPRGMADGEGG